MNDRAIVTTVKDRARKTLDDDPVRFMLSGLGLSVANGNAEDAGTPMACREKQQEGARAFLEKRAANLARFRRRPSLRRKA